MFTERLFSPMRSGHSYNKISTQLLGSSLKKASVSFERRLRCELNRIISCVRVVFTIREFISDQTP